MTEAKKRGRPAADPEFGAQPGAMRQHWYRKRQERVQRRMAVLLLDLWERQPAGWREGKEYMNADVLAVARRLTESPDD
jgi:hypothetical protein